MGYSTSQRLAFAGLVATSTLAVALMLSANVADGWLILYAALLPIGFRLLIVASDRADPLRLVRAVRIWRALRRREIVLHYQPKVAIGTAELHGVEALARWQHPRRGVLLPGEWLPATEHPWVGRRFCAYVLDEAVRQAAAWRGKGHDFTVSVNVTPRWFSQRSLPDWVAARLAECELPAAYLTIELTEEALDLSSDSLAVAHDLTALGVTLALDDFGTGHSSMDRLVGLPLTELKIDKRFVSRMVVNERNRAVVEATISLGRSLGMSVVAEGVESPATQRSLAAAGCEVAQGFLFSPAMPASELERWIDRAGRTSRDGAATSA